MADHWGDDMSLEDCETHGEIMDDVMEGTNALEFIVQHMKHKTLENELDAEDWQESVKRARQALDIIAGAIHPDNGR